MTSAAPELPVGARVVRTYAGRLMPDHPDEFLTGPGRLRPPVRDLAGTVDLLGVAGLLARRAELARLVEDEGVTYGVRDIDGRPPAGEPAGARAGRWRVDPLPVVIAAQEWALLEVGLAERADLLDHLLTDLTGPRRLMREGVIPPEVVLAHAGFVRAADGAAPSGGHRRLVLQACDLARDGDGGWVVLGDRTQAPSGAGYAMQNRRLISRVMPGLYRTTRLERLRTFFHTMRAALQEAAPATAEAPRVVVLTPGPSSETAFDQSFLSTLLGYPLVEGEDLSVRGGRVFQLSLGRDDVVDVVLRRVDAAYADPLELRPDSRLGVPGLVEAARLGNVALANPISAGVLENPGLLPYLPAVARRLLGTDPALPAAQTWWCGEPAARSHVLANLERLVVKPITREAGRLSSFGEHLSAAERERLRRRIEAEPYAWCGQEPVAASTAPVVTRTGLEPRRLVLRTFAVAQGGRYHLMAGGLARVAAESWQRLVTGAAGAVAKDVWVLTADDAAAAGAEPGARDVVALSLLAPLQEAAPALPPRVAENLFWLGRYAERAEDTVRLLRVVDDLADDYTARPGTAGARSLEVLLRAVTAVTDSSTPAMPGFTGRGARDRLAAPRRELVSLVVDGEREGSVAQAVRRVSWAAHAVREQLSMDTWTVLGSLDRVLAELADATLTGAASTGATSTGDTLVSAGDVPLQPALARALEGLLALAGLGAESMVRDTGWYLMDAGRRIERALQVARLLRHTVVRRRSLGVEQLVLESVLTAGESIITHRRRHAGRAEVRGVLDLLLLDRSNPRAVAYQLDRLAEDLGRLPEVDGARSPGLLRAVGARLREADLSARDRRPVTELLDALVAGLEGLAAALGAEHFVHLAAPRAFGVPAMPPADPMSNPMAGPLARGSA